MKINPGMIIGVLLSLIFLGLLLKIATAVIPQAASSYHTFATSVSGNSTLYGADAAAFAADTPGYLGYFWVLGPFVLVLMLIIGMFMRRR